MATGKGQRGLRVIYGMLLLLWLAVPGCGGKPDPEAPGIVEDGQLYILLNNNTDSKRLFLECVETGRQEDFDYDEKTLARGHGGGNTTLAELPVGELVQLTYTEEKLLKEVSVSEGTFAYEGVSDYTVDTESKTITVEKVSYRYGEKLRIFSGEKPIPINVLEEREAGDTVCVRGREQEILTVVVTPEEE